ncbi:hypothetical protein QMK33_16465 [Hymenobacter sp. H14-R3]|uniref:hypothetical protein n=1 Tax=Hymenobacter sp. H14-R3 TaxID=3046308 RepID=UPI0024BA2C13|nr:hypothetical protein [Hymenobacter sp. H14-R3]MDJ0366750.1 hypothetical protein [Hymenobacter sp. H14-R3]
MKNILLAGCLLLTLGACRKDADTPTPDYADWYALRAPDDRAIEAVAGDIDETLVITTRFKIYQTTDRGKTWQTGDYQQNLGIFGFLARADTLLALTAGTSASSALLDSANYTTYAASPSVFSLDKGLTWKPYRNWERENFKPRVALNRLKASSGTEYSITYRYTPTAPGSDSYYSETVGIKNSVGQRLALPKKHQIESLYFDTKSRLYVAASAARCGTIPNTTFCGEQNGVLYVSKKPLL